VPVVPGEQARLGGPVVPVGPCSVTAGPVGTGEVLESAEPVVSAEPEVVRV
jgi:hypothetical protein